MTQRTAVSEQGANPHFLGLEGAETMQTLSFARTQEAWADTVEAGGLAVVHGDAGRGKSFATNYAAAAEELPVTAFTFEPRTTLKRMTEAILRGVSGVPHIGSRFSLLDALAQALAERPRVLTIDEAQLLSHEAIETLRWLWDAAETQFALILVGGNGCWEHIEAYPMLRSRVFTRVAFEALSEDDVLEVIPHYHFIYAETTATTITDIDERFAHGNFREWAAFTNMAHALCKRDEQLCVNQALANEALERIGRLNER